MELKFLNEKENPLMHRKEIEFIVEHIKEKTPTRKEIKEMLKALKDYDPNLVVIKKIKNVYGIGKDKVLAFVYENKEFMKKIEDDYLFKREEEESGESQ
jgi:ribosomal protein S24E